jgi:DNA-binding GntR family transcriptional regulator
MRDGMDTADHQQMPDAPPSPSGRTAAVSVVTQLRRRIASQVVPPGARLREWDVAEEFGIPRLAAREVLDALVHLGFVRRVPNRGVLVHQRTIEEILQLFDMREVNEGLCARLAARNAGAKTWDDLITLFGARMQAIVQAKDLHAYALNYQKMHERLIETAASPPLADLLQRLHDMTSIYGQRILLLTDRTQQALKDHRAVLAALKRRDADAAETARRSTIANVRSLVEQYASFVR